jgi:hypothetical protein
VASFIAVILLALGAVGPPGTLSPLLGPIWIIKDSSPSNQSRGLILMGVLLSCMVLGLVRPRWWSLPLAALAALVWWLIGLAAECVCCG